MGTSFTDKLIDNLEKCKKLTKLKIVLIIEENDDLHMGFIDNLEFLKYVEINWKFPEKKYETNIDR